MDEATSSVSCTHTLMNAALAEEEVGIVLIYACIVRGVSLNKDPNLGESFFFQHLVGI